MIDKELLEILACPDTKQDLVEADPELIEKINAQITKGALVNRSRQKITDKIDGGLIQKDDRKYLYPVVNKIPVLLIDESIALEDVK